MFFLYNKPRYINPLFNVEYDDSDDGEHDHNLSSTDEANIGFLPPIEDLNEWFWDRKETWERKRKRKKGLEKKSPHEGEYDFEGDRVLMVSVFFFAIIALTQNYVVRRPSPRHKSNPMAHSPQIDLESV